MNNKVISLETSKYELRLDNFEGPLDLLCYLIDKNKMDIYKVSISDITDQYVSYLQKQEQFNLEIASEFLVMASTLLLLKSKGLLPSLEEKEEIIDKVLNGLNEDIRSLLKVICKNRRAAIIPNVIEEFNSLVNHKRGILEGLVYTIYPLKEKELKDIENKISEIEKVPCELKNIIDATIIGGVKVAINGHVYDGSIANKIEQMRLTLNK